MPTSSNPTVFTAVINRLPLLMPSINNLPSNAELEFEKDHEYFLNKLPSQRGYRVSAKNTVMHLCEEPSTLFRSEASRNPSILNGPVSGQN